MEGIFDRHFPLLPRGHTQVLLVKTRGILSIHYKVDTKLWYVTR